MPHPLFADGFKTTPYWWEAATPARFDAALPDETDVAIVGGGYAGLNCALTLARAGTRVVVMDAAEIGWGASSRNGGMVSGGLKVSDPKVAKLHGEDVARRIIEDGWASFAHLEDIIRRENIQCDYVRSGRFVGAHTPKDYAAQAAKAPMLREVTGSAVEMVPRERQHEEIGSDYYYGGMVVEGTGALHPAKYVRGLAAAAEAAGATLCSHARAESIAHDAGGFVIKTTRGSIRAREVMAATNGYTGDVTPWLRRRLIPVGSYIIATEPLAADVTRRLSPKGRMFSDSKKVLYYFRLSPDGSRVLFGGRASFRQTTPETAAPVLHGFMTGVWPELAQTKITHSWTGNVAFTFDMVPHMGVHDGVHYAMGCQGSGVAMASYLGNQVALKLLGRQNRPSAFDGLPFPTRPLYRGKPWFLPIVGGWYRMTDKWARWRA
ncbi:MAG: NAD(P)/FAD-dependent oxidoreductase [Alphaproteobacteria bacterium]